MRVVRISLAKAANEMVQEEVGKRISHLSKNISNVRFEDGGSTLLFDTTEESGQIEASATDLALSVQRSLRNLERKLVYASLKMSRPVFAGDGTDPGIHLLGTGQVALDGIALSLYQYFDRVFRQFGDPWCARPLLTPTLIPASTLARCDYFRSFPHNVTFAAHLFEDADGIADFRSRHQERDTLDEKALTNMETPEACLSPATCYHVYHLFANRSIPSDGFVYGVCGKCFRYESSNMKDLRRLWDFTMREVVFMGDRDYVLAQREKGIEMTANFLESHQLAGEIRTASDPFFTAPDASAKAYFQLSAETKYEMSLLLPSEARLAVGSLNYHTDFFGRAFNIDVERRDKMHSVCIAFGLERWVYAFLAQHGNRVDKWPDVVRDAPEFA